MITIVVADAHILVNGTDRYSLDFEAYCLRDEIGIRHINQQDLNLFKGRVHPDEITLNGVTYGNAIDFVYAFNAVTAPALSYLLTNLKASTENIEEHTSYPPNLFSQHWHPSIVTEGRVVPIPAIGKAGYVTLTAMDANTSPIYVGETGVNATNYHLEPGKSNTWELNDIGDMYVLAVTTGDGINSTGGYKD